MINLHQKQQTLPSSPVTPEREIMWTS